MFEILIFYTIDYKFNWMFIFLLLKLRTYKIKKKHLKKLRSINIVGVF